MIKYEKNLDDIPLFSILKTCESICEFNSENIFIKSRRVPLSEKRHIFYYVANEMTERTYREVSEFTDNWFGMYQSHCNLIHGIKTIDNLISYQKVLKQEINDILNVLFTKHNHQTIIVEDINLKAMCI